jgi:hypothetical protein
MIWRKSWRRCGPRARRADEPRLSGRVAPPALEGLFCVFFYRPLRTGLTYAAPPALVRGDAAICGCASRWWIGWSGDVGESARYWCGSEIEVRVKGCVAPTALGGFFALGSRPFRAGLTCAAPPALVRGDAAFFEGASRRIGFLVGERLVESGGRATALLHKAGRACVGRSSRSVFVSVCSAEFCVMAKVRPDGCGWRSALGRRSCRISFCA